MNILGLESRVVRAADIVATEMDNELVMMSIERGLYLGIVGVGPRIWELLENPTTVADICRNLCSEYDVETPVCHQAVLGFLSDLAGNGLVSLQ